MSKLGHYLNIGDKKGIKKIFYNLQSFWYNCWIRNLYYNIQEGIENIILYLPTIWQDRNFDYVYLYRIIHKKLEIMEKHMKSEHCWDANAEKTAKQVRICKNLLKRLVESNYLNSALSNYHKKYGVYITFEQCEDNPKLRKMVDKSSPRQRKMLDKAYKHSDYMEQQDLDMVFKIMHKYIRGWWD